MDQRKGPFHPPFFQIYFVTWDLNLINMYIDLKKWTIIFLLVISQNRHIKHIWIMRWQHKFTGWLQNQTHHPWKVWGRAEAAQQEFRASTHFLVWGWQHSYINMSYIWLNMADKASIEQFAPGKDSEDTKCVWWAGSPHQQTHEWWRNPVHDFQGVYIQMKYPPSRWGSP